MSIRPHPALDALMRDYADIGARSRIGVRITPAEMSETYSVSVIGVIRSKRILLLTAPLTEEGALVAVHSGQLLTCRWFGTTTAFRFRARIVRILFDPVPQIQVELPPIVERHNVRGVPRGLSYLRASVKGEKESDAVIVDISTSGARIAVPNSFHLQRNDELVLKARPRMLHRPFDLTVDCDVVAAFGNADTRHPQVQFYGVEFNEMPEATLLIVHAYVQECLSFETDSLGQVLLLDSVEVEAIEQ
jgi:hypothetical protein